MPLPILNLTPDRESYRVDRGSSVNSTMLKGGMGRYRRDQLGASSKVPCTFTLDPFSYAYIMAFFRSTLEEGSLPFQINLISESAVLEPYKAYCMGGDNQSGISLLSQSGLTYIVGTTLEVVPINPVNAAYDAALVAAYSVYGDDTSSILTSLSNLVNIDLAS